MHVKLLSELHSVDSPEVRPTPTLAECPYIPSPEPITTISSFPGSIRLDVPNIDTTPESTDTDPPIDPTCTPDVTPTVLVRETDCDGKHSMAVADIHSDRSHVVCPTRTVSDSEYRLKPLPVMLICMSPPHPPFAPLIELNVPVSTVNTSEWLPSCSPAVTTTRMVCPARCNGLKLLSDVSESHELIVLDVHPCRTDIAPLGLMIPSPLPATVTTLLCVDIPFRVAAPDTSVPSYDATSLPDPVALPSVTVTLQLLPVPTAALHRMAVSDIHALSSHPVDPTRPIGLAPPVQKLSPIMLIRVPDAPCTFTPPPVCTSSSTSVFVFPHSKQELERLKPATLSPSLPRAAPLTTALSYDTALLMLIT